MEKEKPQNCRKQSDITEIKKENLSIRKILFRMSSSFFSSLFRFKNNKRKTFACLANFIQWPFNIFNTSILLEMLSQFILCKI